VSSKNYQFGKIYKVTDSATPNNYLVIVRLDDEKVGWLQPRGDREDWHYAEWPRMDSLYGVYETYGKRFATRWPFNTKMSRKLVKCIFKKKRY